MEPTTSAQTRRAGISWRCPVPRLQQPRSKLVTAGRCVLIKLGWIDAAVPETTQVQGKWGSAVGNVGFRTRTLNRVRPPQAEAARKADAARQAAVAKAPREAEETVRVLGVVLVLPFTFFVEAAQTRGAFIFCPASAVAKITTEHEN